MNYREAFDRIVILIAVAIVLWVNFGIVSAITASGGPRDFVSHVLLIVMATLLEIAGAFVAMLPLSWIYDGLKSPPRV